MAVLRDPLFPSYAVSASPAVCVRLRTGSTPASGSLHGPVRPTLTPQRPLSTPMQIRSHCPTPRGSHLASRNSASRRIPPTSRNRAGCLWTSEPTEPSQPFSFSRPASRFSPTCAILMFCSCSLCWPNGSPGGAMPKPSKAREGCTIRAQRHEPHQPGRSLRACPQPSGTADAPFRRQSAQSIR